MVGTRDRVPLGIGLSFGDLRRRHAGGGPARVPIRFLGIRFSRFPGAFRLPSAASFRPRRKEIYYAHPLPGSRGNRTFFLGRGASGGSFPDATWDYALRLPFGPCTQLLHKPRKGCWEAVRASRYARTGVDQMFPSPTNQASPALGRAEQLSGRINRSEIRRRGRCLTIYSSFLPAETFPALQWHPYYRKRPSASRAPGLLNG